MRAVSIRWIDDEGTPVRWWAEVEETRGGGVEWLSGGRRGEAESMLNFSLRSDLGPDYFQGFRTSYTKGEDFLRMG